MPCVRKIIRIGSFFGGEIVALKTYVFCVQHFGKNKMVDETLYYARYEDLSKNVLDYLFSESENCFCTLF